MEECEVADAVDAFAGWHPAVTEMVGATDVGARWALYDLAPLERWHTDRVVLMGDAAHAMVPHQGQGANQTIEDAIALAECLADGGDLAPALRAYAARRQERTAPVQRWSRSAADLLHLPDGPDIPPRDALFTALYSELAGSMSTTPSALLGHPLPDVRSVDGRVVAGDVDPRPVAVELVAVPDDVVVQGHQGAGDEVVGVDGVGLRRHGGVVARGDEPRRGVDLLQLGVGEQRWAARLERLDHAADRHGRGEQVGVDRGHLHRHVAAVAAAGDVDPPAVDRVPADEIADDLADQRRKAGPVLDPERGALRGHDVGAAEDPLRLPRGEAQRTAVGPQRRLVVVVAIGQQAALTAPVQPDDERAPVSSAAVEPAAVTGRVQPVVHARSRRGGS